MDHWLAQIDRNTEKFMTSFGNLTDEQLNWKPASGVWSIAQNMEHLMLLNTSYFQVLEELRQGNNNMPFSSIFGFMASYYGNSIKKFAQPDRTVQGKTFSIWQPADQDYDRTILTEFIKHQD